jgi:hypothetical protein
MAIVKKQDWPEPCKLTEAVAANALASKFDWFRNLVLPNVYLCGGEMDLAVITPAGYLWEFEVKMNLSDWKADANKAKWSHPGRRFVSRFYYVVPEALVEKEPDFVPPSAGIIKLHHTKWDWRASVVREPKGRRGEKVTPHMREKFYTKSYFRYWRNRHQAAEPYLKIEYDGSLEDL